VQTRELVNDSEAEPLYMQCSNPPDPLYLLNLYSIN